MREQLRVHRKFQSLWVAHTYIHQEKISIVWTWMIHKQSAYIIYHKVALKIIHRFPSEKSDRVCVFLLWFSGVSFTSSWSQRRCRSGQVYFGTSANRVWNMKPSVINNGNSENNNPNMTQHQQTPSDTNNNRNNTDSRGFPSPFSSVSVSDCGSYKAYAMITHRHGRFEWK